MLPESINLSDYRHCGYERGASEIEVPRVPFVAVVPEVPAVPTVHAVYAVMTSLALLQY